MPEFPFLEAMAPQRGPVTLPTSLPPVPLRTGPGPSSNPNTGPEIATAPVAPPVQPQAIPETMPAVPQVAPTDPMMMPEPMPELALPVPDFLPDGVTGDRVFSDSFQETYGRYPTTVELQAQKFTFDYKQRLGRSPTKAELLGLLVSRADESSIDDDLDWES